MTTLARLRGFSLALIVALTIGALTGAAYVRHEAAAVTGHVQAGVTLTETATTNFGGKARVTPGISFDQWFGSGTGARALDKKWCDRRTIAASGADTLKLTGTLTNEYGATVTFAKVLVWAVRASKSNTNDVWFGGAAANRFNTLLKDSSVVVVKPGVILLVAGDSAAYAVTASTAHLLLAKNSAGTTPVTYDICLGGTST